MELSITQQELDRTDLVVPSAVTASCSGRPARGAASRLRPCSAASLTALTAKPVGRCQWLVPTASSAEPVVSCSA